MNRLISVVFLFLLFCSTQGHAQLIIPGNATSAFLGTIPEQPVAGQPYLVRASMGPCEVISVDPSVATVLNVSASAFTIRVPGGFVDNCSAPIRETVYNMPPIAQAGTYAVTLQMIDDGDFASLGTRLVTVVAPGGAASRAISIPASGPFAWASLVLAFLGFARLRLHRERWQEAQRSL